MGDHGRLLAWVYVPEKHVGHLLENHEQEPQLEKLLVQELSEKQDEL